LVPAGRRVPASPVELLTEQFYRWEKRGRGWQTWDYPVGLSRPSSRLLPLRRRSGRTSTMLEADNPQSSHGLIVGAVMTKHDAGEADPRHLSWRRLRRKRTKAEEAGGLGPHAGQVGVPPEAVEQFLLALPRLSRPIGFEVVGTADAISVQVVCAASDRSTMRNNSAYFPEGVVSSHDGHRAELAAGDPGHWSSLSSGSPRVVWDAASGPVDRHRRGASDLEAREAGVLQCSSGASGTHGRIMQAVLDEQEAFFLDAPEVRVGEEDAPALRLRFASRVVALGEPCSSPAR
jgi:hypothetical protein